MKNILDPCCGSRMFWFDKNNPSVVFGDNRELNTTLCDGRKLEINPDVKIDFRNSPFGNNTFKLVVFDPPHLKQIGETSWMAQKYGKLGENWRDDIKKGFAECMRVLDNNGVLIFKWNEQQIKVSEILGLINYRPLFGHKSGKLQKTHWICFIKSIEQLITTPSDSATQVSKADEHNISLKTTTSAPSKLPTATPLNNNIKRNFEVGYK